MANAAHAWRRLAVNLPHNLKVVGSNPTPRNHSESLENIEVFKDFFMPQQANFGKLANDWQTNGMSFQTMYGSARAAIRVLWRLGDVEPGDTCPGFI